MTPIRYALRFTTKFIVVTAAMLIIFMSATSLAGQVAGFKGSDFELDAINRRVTILEDVDAKTRLAVIERIMEDINKRLEKSPIDYLSQGGIGVLLLKAALDVRKKGKLNESSE